MKRNQERGRHIIDFAGMVRSMLRTYGGDL